MLRGDRFEVFKLPCKLNVLRLKMGGMIHGSEKSPKGSLNKVNSNAKQTIQKGVNIVNYTVIISLTKNVIHDS
jgi:hypothetical protein